MSAPRRRFALIGFGAIAAELIKTLAARGELADLAGVLVRGAGLTAARERAAGRFPVVSDAEDLAALDPGIAVECAGHGAMLEHAPALLRRKIDVLCSSVGVLTDPAFAREVLEAPAEVWIPSGAVAGLDGLIAARTAGLQRVTYTSVKPPQAWIGTAAEDKVRDAPGGERLKFFRGTAREAASAYPKNANVAAAIALAGLGLERTTVELVSDPAAVAPLGVIDAEGEFGRFHFEILAYAAPDNPKTSLLTAHSLLAAVRHRLYFSAKDALRRGT